MYLRSLAILVGVLTVLNTSWVKSAKLSLDCPFDADGGPALINDGVVDNCTCTFTDPGNPVEKVRWIHPKGYVVAEGKHEVSLEIAYNSDWYQCDNQWTFYPKAITCLRNFLPRQTWFDARAECQKQGGDLVKITDNDFMQFILNNINVGSRQGMWIGLQDLDEDGVFHWLNETEELTYEDWGAHRPDNRGGNERCGEISIYYGSVWNDVNCNKELFHICQKDPEYDDNQNQTYTCEGISTVGGRVKQTYTFNFRIGPHNVTANLSDVNYDMFADHGPVYVHCEVDKYRTNPKPNVTIQGIFTDPLQPVSEEETSSSWVFYFNIEPQSGDVYTAKCVAENIGAAMVEDQFNLTVWGPPSVELSGCPFDVDGVTPAYVKEDASSSCNCTITGPGNPEGEAVFFARGVEVSSGNPIATFVMNKSDNDVLYTCVGRNQNGNGTNVTYRPRIAYGPDQVTIGPPEASNLQITDVIKSVGYEMYCDIELDTFSPDISVHLEMTPGGTLNPNSPFQIISAVTRRYIFKYLPTSAGTVTAQCVAANSKFSEIRTTNTITINSFELPEASFMSDCPLDGDAPSYIAEGVTMTCTCSLTTVGSPPGSVRWVNSLDEQISAGTTSAVLTLSYDPNRQDNRFTCVPFSPAGEGSRKTYEAIFAYGPSSLTFAAVGIPAVKICPGASTSMVIDCQVPSSSVHPAPEFSITGVPSGTTPSASSISDGNLLHQRFEFHLNESGSHTITCMATNPITGNTAQFTRERMIAAAPPTSPPSITIDGGPTITDGSDQSIQVGSSVIIKCIVEGGYPSVERVTLTCGDLELIAIGKEATVPFLVKYSTDRTVCSCSAVHVSRCYSLKSQFTIDVFDASLNNNDKSNAVAWGLGATIAFLIILAILVVLICYKKKKGGNNRPPTAHQEQQQQLRESRSAADNRQIWQAWEAFENQGFRPRNTVV